MKVTRGYLFKNEAQALLPLGRDDECEEALDNGERVFRTICQENSKDAAAWNGLGSVVGIGGYCGEVRGKVAAARGDYDEVLGYIDRALELVPNREAALTDRGWIEGRLASIS